jgi:selenium metabolism protein YedF
MQKADQVVTLVDNETSLKNVSRMAEKAGWTVGVVSEGDEYHIEITKQGTATEAEPLAVGRAEVSDAPPVLVVPSDVMGRGAPELGNILIRSFFHTLGEVEPLPQTIVFFNTGVKLACDRTQVLDDLRALEAKGVELLVCGTCLGYFELTEKLAVGQVSNMYDIAETMLGAGSIVNL